MRLLKIIARLVRDSHSFKQGFDSFLKVYINALLRQSLIAFIDLSWACDPSLRAFDML